VVKKDIVHEVICFKYNDLWIFFTEERSDIKSVRGTLQWCEKMASVTNCDYSEKLVY
jgi:hypothetical protein